MELKSRASDDPDVYGALASFYEATGQKEKAVAELQALMAAKPKDAAIKAHLTDTLIDLNRIEEAVTAQPGVAGRQPRRPARALLDGPHPDRTAEICGREDGPRSVRPVRPAIRRRPLLSRCCGKFSRPFRAGTGIVRPHA